MQIASEKIILLLMEKWMKIYERIELILLKVLYMFYVNPCM